MSSPDAAPPAPPRGLRFDFTVNLGHVLSVGAVIVTMALGWSNFDARLRAVERALEVATTTLIEQVKLDGRVTSLELRLARVEERER